MIPKKLPPLNNPKAMVAVGLIAVGALVVLAAIGGWIFRLVIAAIGLAAIWVGVKLLWPKKEKDEREHPGAGR